jgi:hypothetical protein
LIAEEILTTDKLTTNHLLTNYTNIIQVTTPTPPNDYKLIAFNSGAASGDENGNAYNHAYQTITIH